MNKIKYNPGKVKSDSLIVDSSWFYKNGKKIEVYVKIKDHESIRHFEGFEIKIVDRMPTICLTLNL